MSSASSIDRIEATRDLVGSFSILLDEFAACWGGLRIANDQMRSALLLDLTEGIGARVGLAEWIEARLEGPHADLIAPLVSLLWSSGGTTRGALHTFDLSIDPDAPIGIAHLAEALNAAFEAHLADHTVGGPTLRGSATELLMSAASADHRFGLPPEVEEQLDRATGALWIAALDPYFRTFEGARLTGADTAWAALAISRGWRHHAVAGLVEMVALPGLLVRQHALTPLVAPHTEALLSRARRAEDLPMIRERIGPGLVTAWDSFAHAFGDHEDQDSEAPSSIDIEHDPFREPGGYRDAVGPEASRLLDEGTWFAGLLTDDAAVPRLGGGIRSLLADSPISPSRSGDPRIATALLEARTRLERLSNNIGEPAAAHLTALRAKAASLDSFGGPETDSDLVPFILRVADGLVRVADEASAFAEHLDRSERAQIGDLDLGLRLAAIVAWLDGVARWVVSDAHAPTATTVERLATPPPGYRDPRKVVDDMVSALPEHFSVAEYRLVIEQREAQWEELATFDDAGPPDLEQDCGEVVDFEGFANR